MLPPDIAFAQFINQTAAAYRDNAPAYMTYRERTHITVGGSFHGTQDINRSVSVRQTDNFAVMQDLPNGGTTTGQAFPIIAYFNPLSDFGFGFYVNMKRRDIQIERTNSYYFNLPQPDPGVDALVYYNPYFKPSYLAGSTDAAPRFHVDLIYTKLSHYVSEMDIDPATHLPGHVVVTFTGQQMTVTMDYQVLQGHWVVTRGNVNSVYALGPLRFIVVAETNYDQFAFPQTAPDPKLQ